MELPNGQVLLGTLLFATIQLVVAAIKGRSVHTKNDFFVAGSRLGLMTTTFGIFANWFGAETCVGATAWVNDFGLWGLVFDPLGVVVGLMLTARYLSRRICGKKYTTLADALRVRYDGEVEVLYALLGFPLCLLWAAAQVRAFGQVLSFHSAPVIAGNVPSVATDLSGPNLFTHGFVFIFVIVYMFIGGMESNLISDIVHSIILSVGATILFGVEIFNLPPWTEVSSKLLQPHKDVAMEDFYKFRNGVFLLEQFLIASVGSFGSDEIVGRMISAKNPETAQRGGLIASLMYLSVGTFTVLLGMTTRFSFSERLGEKVLPSVVQKYLSNVGNVIMCGALTSSILTTLDSTLLAAGALITQNLLPLFRIEPTLWHARLCVIVCGVAACILSYNSTSVVTLIQESSSITSSGISVVVVIGLIPKQKFGGPKAAKVCIVSGTLAYIAGKYWWGISFPFSCALVVATAAYVSATLQCNEREERCRV